MRRRNGVVAALIVVAGVGGYLWWHGSAGPGSAPGRRGRDPDTPVPVLAAEAVRRDVPVHLDALGTVQAFNTVSVRSMVDGPLLEVDFREGQDLRVGDVLARIDARTYQASLDSAVAKKQQDEANLANARLDAARYAKLVASNYSSAQQADTARAQVTQLEAQVRADQAAIDTARTQLSYTTITAPIGGRAGIRQMDAGNIVRSVDTTPLVVLTQLQPISVVFTLPQQSLPAVQAAMAGGAPEVDAVRAGAGEAPGGAAGESGVIDRGQVAVLDNQVDAATGTIKLKATFPNAGLQLWPGGFVNVRLLVRVEQGVVVVPPPAVQRSPRGPYVFVVRADGTAERRPVTLGYEDEGLSVVRTGLQPGERVVTEGAQRVVDGGKVAVAGPDGNAPEAVPVRDRAAPGARVPSRSG